MSSVASEVSSTNSDGRSHVCFLPRFTAKESYRPRLEESRILASYDDVTKKMTFEYEVTWSDEVAKLAAGAVRPGAETLTSRASGQEKVKKTRSDTSSSGDSCASKDRCDAKCRCEGSVFSCCTTSPCCQKSWQVDSEKPSKRKDKSKQQNKTAEVSEQSFEEGVEAHRKCDGPCGKPRYMKNLWLMGCEHAICALCLSNARMIEGDDQKLRCCNRECFAAELVARMPDGKQRRHLQKKLIQKESVDSITNIYRPLHGRRRLSAVQYALEALPSEKSTCSISEKSEPTSSLQGSARFYSELISLSVVIVSRGQCRARTYRRLHREIADTKLFYDLLEWIVLTGDLPAPIDQAAIFLSKSPQFRPEDLTLVNVEKALSKQLWQFHNVTEGTFFVAIDYTGSFHQRSR
ncbi:hypothetical protein QR680_016573 [Steinernema hermaphroditum]|uniref:Uncharacterized protein n=1 Tax=Steinernema hermaphroditum TaxID=289476 RepID=A0AA39HBL8_9BILA|nr:hypothetical protein QR680_016573 [Steinernema hermaphroditum]